MEIIVEGHREHVSCTLCGAPSKQTERLFEKIGFRVVRCPRCELVYVSPRLIQGELWKRYSQEYFDNEYLPAFGPFDPQANLTFYQSHLQKLRGYAPDGRYLLDVGCATGYFLDAASRAGWQVAGTEVSEYAAEYARRKFNFDVRTEKVETAHLSDGQYDAVTMWEVLEHLQDPQASLSSIYSAMSPGGVLGLSTPNFASLTRLLVGKDWWVIGPSEHIYYFTPVTLRKILEKTGFQVLEIAACNLSLGYIRDHWISRLFGRLLAAGHCQAAPTSAGNLTSAQPGWLARLRLRVWNAIYVRLQARAVQYGRGDTLVAYARKPALITASALETSTPKFSPWRQFPSRGWAYFRRGGIGTLWRATAFSMRRRFAMRKNRIG